METSSQLSVFLIVVLSLLCHVTSSIAPYIIADKNGTYYLSTGGSVYLDCGEHVNTVLWKLHAITDDDIVVYSPKTGNYECAGPSLVNSSKCRENFQIDSYMGRYINIKSVRMEDAGTYICLNGNSSSIQFKVTVYDASMLNLRFTNNDGAVPPFIEDRFAVNPNDVISFTCGVTFSGFWPPPLELVLKRTDFSQKWKNTSDTYNDSEIHFNEVAKVTSMVQISQRDNGLSAICQMGILSTTSSNPNIFRIIFGPVLPSAIQPETVYLTDNGKSGNYLDCKADSYPSASFIWKMMNELTGKTVVLSENASLYWAMQTGRYSCEAINVLSDIRPSKQFIVREPQTNTPDETSNQATVMFSAAGICIFIIFGILIIACMLKCKRRTIQSANSGSPILQHTSAPEDAYVDIHVDSPPTYAEVMLELPTVSSEVDKKRDKPTRPVEREESLPSYSVAVRNAAGPP